MRNILSEIIHHKREEVKQTSRVRPLPHSQPAPLKSRSLAAALRAPGIGVIAEIKRRSPSAGDISPGAYPVQIALDYERAGAAAISILTDEKYFGGNLDILRQVRQAVTIPVLRKDFIITEYQVHESADAGTDGILLITEALTKGELARLYTLAGDLGLDVLVEFHDPANLSIISDLNPHIVGVNCRDLTTMTTDLKRFESLFHELPHDAVKVAESGIKKAVDLEYVASLGYDAALVGTSLMRSGEPGAALEKMLEGVA